MIRIEINSGVNFLQNRGFTGLGVCNSDSNLSPDSIKSRRDLISLYRVLASLDDPIALND